MVSLIQFKLKRRVYYKNKVKMSAFSYYAYGFGLD